MMKEIVLFLNVLLCSTRLALSTYQPVYGDGAWVMYNGELVGTAKWEWLVVRCMWLTQA